MIAKKTPLENFQDLWWFIQILQTNLWFLLLLIHKIWNIHLLVLPAIFFSSFDDVNVSRMLVSLHFFNHSIKESILFLVGVSATTNTIDLCIKYRKTLFGKGKRQQLNSTLWNDYGKRGMKNVDLRNKITGINFSWVEDCLKIIPWLESNTTIFNGQTFR